MKIVIPKKFQKIFITGGAGFIGSHIAEELIKDKRKVVVFDNLSTGKKVFLKEVSKSSNLTFIKGDLLKLKEIDNALSADTDLVIHLAANTDVSKGYKDTSVDFNQTVVGTYNVLSSMQKIRLKNLVFFSTSMVYGNTGNKVAHEDFFPLQPVSIYGATKLSAENLINVFSKLFDMQVWIFRPANIIGDRSTHGVVGDFVHKLQKNQQNLEIIGNGSQTRSYVHIKDVTNAVFIALEKGKDPINVFNISSSSLTTVNEIAQLVVEEMKLKRVKISYTSAGLGWPGDSALIQIDSTRLKKIGWKEQYSSKDAVKQTIKEMLHK